ncbi:NADPH:quinone oxidoreductase family protein [Novosphingobium sp. KCTC 2891]|uniref:NADPH:quinone oxidoreductase family protein n=1 Tax=unclassified Novosphingobium TaxID=2644732 RepID=UPI002221FF98|nr:NADPH:quinone oxidoreductase family protein [Novosphingobium sp. KCTC 2891]MCW1384796.1 NADPH:quinone oxidoreductase family protein [Novosphingobium sp. KCTC 2891]
MPRAVLAEEFGDPEAYQLRDLHHRSVEPGTVRIAIKAAGISYVDVLTAQGRYQVKPPLPFCPGSEAAGIVRELGEGVTGLAVGDAVSVGHWGGLFSDEAVLPAHTVRPMPPGLDFAEAAVFPVSYATAWHALVDRGQLRLGETLLVLGAGGATGYAAIQTGKHLGARVIASASSETKRALALAGGADAVVDARAADWREQVKAASDGHPINVVFDPVGGDATDPAFRCLGWGGRHLVVGFPGGIATLRTNLPLLKGASLIGVDLRQFGAREPDKAEANRQAIFALATAGVLRPVVARRHTLDDFRAAMRDAAAGTSAGRIVLIMD